MEDRQLGGYSHSVTSMGLNREALWQIIVVRAEIKKMVENLTWDDTCAGPYILRREDLYCSADLIYRIG